jgi:hypothetical protein
MREIHHRNQKSDRDPRHPVPIETNRESTARPCDYAQEKIPA